MRSATVLIHPDIGDPLAIANDLSALTCCPIRTRGNRLAYLALVLDEGRRAVEFKPGLPAKALTHYQEVANVEPFRLDRRVDRQPAEEPSPPAAA